MPDLRRSFAKSTAQKKHRPLVTTVLREPGRGFARSHVVDPGRVSALMWTGHGRPPPLALTPFLLPCCAARPEFLRLPVGVKLLASGQGFVACARGPPSQP